MAGQEGFEPPAPGFGVRCSTNSSYWPVFFYFVSLWGVWLRQKGQYFLNSSLFGVFFLFLVVV